MKLFKLISSLSAVSLMLFYACNKPQQSDDDSDKQVEKVEYVTLQ